MKISRCAREEVLKLLTTLLRLFTNNTPQIELKEMRREILETILKLIY